MARARGTRARGTAQPNLILGTELVFHLLQVLAAGVGLPTLRLQAEPALLPLRQMRHLSATATFWLLSLDFLSTLRDFQTGVGLARRTLLRTASTGAHSWFPRPFFVFGNLLRETRQRRPHGARRVATRPSGLSLLHGH